MKDPNDTTETIEEIELGYKIWLLVHYMRSTQDLDDETTLTLAKEILRRKK